MKILLREILFFLNCTLPEQLFRRHTILRLCDWLELGAFWGEDLGPEIQKRSSGTLDTLAADAVIQTENATIQAEFAVTEGDGLEVLVGVSNQHTAEKIRDFAKLPFGWNYGFGIPPEAEIIRQALLVESDLRAASFKETDAFPGTDGEIQVTGYRDGLYLELTIEHDGSVTFVVEQDSREIVNEQLLFEDALERIQDYRVPSGIVWEDHSYDVSYKVTRLSYEARRDGQVLEARITSDSEDAQRDERLFFYCDCLIYPEGQRPPGLSRPPGTLFEQRQTLKEARDLVEQWVQVHWPPDHPGATGGIGRSERA